MNFRRRLENGFLSQQQHSQIPSFKSHPQTRSGKALESGLFYIIAPG